MRVLQVAPVTAQHIFKLVAMGAYTGNHIFRVDKGFVAQVQDVLGGRNLAMDAQQKVCKSSRMVLSKFRSSAVCVSGRLSVQLLLTCMVVMQLSTHHPLKQPCAECSWLLSWHATGAPPCACKATDSYGSCLQHWICVPAELFALLGSGLVIDSSGFAI